MPPISAIRRAAPVFKEFHGVQPTQAVKVRVRSRTMPEVLVVLGRCVAVEYEADSEGSTRKGKVYRHEFGDTGGRKVRTTIYLATDAGKRNFYLVNAEPERKYPVVNSRGIVG